MWDPWALIPSQLGCWWKKKQVDEGKMVMMIYGRMGLGMNKSREGMDKKETGYRFYGGMRLEPILIGLLPGRDTD